MTKDLLKDDISFFYFCFNFVEFILIIVIEFTSFQQVQKTITDCYQSVYFYLLFKVYQIIYFIVLNFYWIIIKLQIYHIKVINYHDNVLQLQFYIFQFDFYLQEILIDSRSLELCNQTNLLTAIQHQFQGKAIGLFLHYISMVMD